MAIVSCAGCGQPTSDILPSCTMCGCKIAVPNKSDTNSLPLYISSSSSKNSILQKEVSESQASKISATNPDFINKKSGWYAGENIVHLSGQKFVYITVKDNSEYLKVRLLRSEIINNNGYIGERLWIAFKVDGSEHFRSAQWIDEKEFDIVSNFNASTKKDANYEDAPPLLSISPKEYAGNVRDALISAVISLFVPAYLVLSSALEKALPLYFPEENLLYFAFPTLLGFALFYVKEIHIFKLVLQASLGVVAVSLLYDFYGLTLMFRLSSQAGISITVIPFIAWVALLRSIYLIWRVIQKIPG